MKKIVIFLVLAALITGGAFAQMSIGGGAFLDMSFGNGFRYEENKNEIKLNTNNTSFGGFVFFDANYVEVDVNFAYGSLRSVLNGSGVTANDGAGSMMQLGFSILGKYPIHLGSFTIFPLIGMNYNMVLSMKDKNGNKPDKVYGFDDKESSFMAEYSQFGLLGGIGLDVPFSNALFFRAEALLNLRLANKSMKDMVDAWKKLSPNDNAKTTLGIGPRIKIGIGFRF